MTRDSSFPVVTASDIRDWRAHLQVSQRGLADHLGISVRTVEDWEGGRRAPPPYLRFAIELVRLLEMYRNGMRTFAADGAGELETPENDTTAARTAQIERELARLAAELTHSAGGA